MNRKKILTAEAQGTQRRESILFSTERVENKKASALLEKSQRPQRLCDEVINLMHLNQLSSKIIGAAIEVHRAIGPGLLESAYEECLCHELMLRGLYFERQKPLPVQYKDVQLDCGYRLDVLVDNQIVLELKSCEQIEPIHKAQLLTYLKLSDLKLGLLLNFNVPVMKDGIVRIVNDFEE